MGRTNVTNLVRTYVLYHTSFLPLLVRETHTQIRAATHSNFDGPLKKNTASHCTLRRTDMIEPSIIYVHVRVCVYVCLCVCVYVCVCVCICVRVDDEMGAEKRSI